MNSDDKMFVKITNRDIYNEIKKSNEDNKLSHAAIITRMDKTNGKVKLNRWIASTALAFIIIVIGWIMNFMRG